MSFVWNTVHQSTFATWFLMKIYSSLKSGTVLDLPYRFTMDGDIEEMEMNDKVNFTDELWATAGGLAVTAAATAAASAAATAAPEMMILGGGPNAIHEYSDTGCCVVS